MPVDQRKLYKTEALVLRHMPMGEADRLVTLLTPRYGKVRAVAKGVRRIKSRMGGTLEQLTRINALIRRGRNLDTISQAETLASNLPLRENLWKTTCGMFMAELVDKFTQEGQESSGIYAHLCESLDALGSGTDPEMVLCHFQLGLLLLTGFQPELRRCVSCGMSLKPTANFFSHSPGGVICPTCRPEHPSARPLSLSALKLLRLVAAGDLQASSRVRIPKELAVELGGLLRQYMRHVLEQDLKSTEFLDLLRREGR